MEDRKRLSINLIAQIFSFTVAVVIHFFLTPFVISKLGAEAYGFIGLAADFISYTSLATVALNSIAARFIAINFHNGEIEKAKKYFSSIYYSNLFLATIIAVVSIFVVLFLNHMIHIPSELEFDVKLLFGLSFLNSIITLTFNVYLVATFVKNRLDLSSVCTIISNLLLLSTLTILFVRFAPHLWYYALATLICSLFLIIASRSLTRKLLPDFVINISLFDFKLVKELISSGGWNLLNKLGEMLSSGLNLLLANLLISAVAMGTFSVSIIIPFTFLSLSTSIAAVFIPKLTELYAKGKMDTLEKELIDNMRIMSVLSSSSIIAFLIFGEEFFRLWVPTQDAHVLYILSAISLVSILLSRPQDSLSNIFIIANKVKVASLNFLMFSFLSFTSILIVISFFDSEYHKLLVIVIAQFIWGSLRWLTFLPIYGAKCLGLKWNTFYSIIFKNIFFSIILMAGFFWAKKYFSVDTWTDYMIFVVIIFLIAAVFMGFFILSRSQRARLVQLIKSKIT